MDDLKQFQLNINIQINAHDEEEAKAILAHKATLEAIVKTILESRENLEEVERETPVKILN